MKESAASNLFRTLFNAMPSMIFVVDDDVRIQEYNAVAADLLAIERSAVLKRRGGEVLHCLHAAEAPEGCGYAPSCTDCVIKKSVAEAFRGNRIVRQRARLELIQDENKQEIFALITATPFLYQQRPLALLVIEDISEIAAIKRMIPICPVCKKVEDEKESWSQVETYFKEHWDVEFSHGFCPECFQMELNKLEKEKKYN